MKSTKQKKNKRSNFKKNYFKFCLVWAIHNLYTLRLLELAKKLGRVKQACKVMRYSLDNHCQFKNFYEQGSKKALQKK